MSLEKDAAGATPARGENVRWAIIGIFLILSLAAIAAGRDFLMPIVLAFLLALVFTPSRRFFGRRGVAPWLFASIVVTALVFAGFVGVSTLSGPVSEWIDDAPRIGHEFERKLDTLRHEVESIVEAGEKLDEIANAANGNGPTVTVEEGNTLQQLAKSAPLLIAQSAFVLVLMFFLLASGDMFYEKIVHALPTLTDKRRAMKIAFDIEERLARYFSTITAINACLGIAITIAMWAIGMPNPALLGLFGFVLNFVPFVGAVIGVLLVTANGILVFPSLWLAFLAGSIYLALTAIEGQVVTPYFVGRSLKLNTVVVFLSVALWAWLWSAVGMIVAVPILVVIRVFSEHVPSLEPIGDFLSARGVEVEEAAEEQPSGQSEAASD